MLLRSLREEVWEANLELVRRGLVLYTFGNVSGISRKDGLIAIKPSGIPYEELTPEQIVITDIAGKTVEGTLRPSSDLATHIELYRQFPMVGGVAHTHSEFATAWAQAKRPIPSFGTTHADYFHGPVPVTDALTADEISTDYEKHTGIAISRIFKNADAVATPAGHAPFCWGANAAEAVHNSVILEYVAKMAYYTLGVQPDVQPIERALQDKHHRRKHGPSAYYGQGPAR
jgi:L-ribulose-5-phosphate 4-epimerase